NKRPTKTTYPSVAATFVHGTATTTAGRDVREDPDARVGWRVIAAASSTQRRRGERDRLSRRFARRRPHHLAAPALATCRARRRGAAWRPLARAGHADAGRDRDLRRVRGGRAARARGPCRGREL